MAQSAYNLSLPQLVLATGSADSSTGTPGIADISDATAIAGYVTAATAPGLILQIAFTTDTGATFFNALTLSSAPALINVTSSVYFTLYVLGGKQLQLASTVSTRATAGSLIATKQVYL